MAKLICLSVNDNHGNWWAEDRNGKKSTVVSTNETWRALDVSGLSEPFTVHLDWGGGGERTTASVSNIKNEEIVVAAGNSNPAMYKVDPDSSWYKYAVTDQR